MHIVWDNDPTAVDRLSFAVKEDATRCDTRLQIERALFDHPEVSLLVIGPEIPLEEACRFAESVRINRAELSVVLLRQRLDVTAMGEALRAGIREVVPVNDHTAILDAVRRCQALWEKLTGNVGAGTSKHGRIVTVFSAKGGVGKTFLATNLAVHLARKGLKTVLVDLDLAFGDDAISLQLRPDRTISDGLGVQGAIDQSAVESMVTTHSASNLDIIAAPSDPGDADRIPASLVTSLLRAASEMYDYVIVDTPPSFTEHVLSACDVSDALLLIATLDIPAVKNLRIALDTLDILGNPSESRVIVLNKADDKVGLRPEDVVSAIKREIAVSIPNSNAVPAAVNRGVPIVIEDPKHPVSAAIREIGDAHVCGRFGAPLTRIDTRRRARRLRGLR